jgi:hypothetical protein
VGKPLNILFQELRLPVTSVIKIRRKLSAAQESAFLGTSW